MPVGISSGEPVNSDFRKRLDELGRIHKIIPIRIKSGHPENERCYRLAVEQREKLIAYFMQIL